MKETNFQGPKLVKSKASFHTTFATMLLPDASQSRLFELSLLILEYAQLLSQIIIFTTKAKVSDSVYSSIAGYVIKASDVINAGYFIGSGESTLAKVVLIMMLCYIVIIYSSILYIFIANTRDKKPIQAIVSYTRLVYQLHGRVISYFILMCAVGWLKINFKDVNRNSDPNFLAFNVISICLIPLNYVLPLCMWTFYSYRLPSKSTLAASSYATEKMTLSQKTFHGVLFLILPVTKHNINGWIRWAYNLSIGITRIREFFIRFPNYNIHALFWKGVMIVTAPTFNICLLAYNIESLTENKPVDIVSWIVTWIIVVIFVEMIYVSLFRQQLSNILIKPYTCLSPYKLIHKPQYMQQVIEYGVPFAGNHSKEALLKITLAPIDVMENESLQDPEDQELEGFDIFQQSGNEIMLHLKSLQGGLAKYPKSDSLKLYCAYYFGKKLGLYSVSMKLIEDVEKSAWLSMNLNAKLLRFELQNSLKVKQAEAEGSLNILEYVNATLKLKKLKQKMIEQARLQLEIYKEWNTEKFDIGKIQIYSKQVESLRATIETKIKHFQQYRTDCYLEPLILFAYYSIQVNFYPTEYFKYIQLYTQKFQRYQSKLAENELTQESLYSSNNIELVLSTDKGSPGAIISCSQNTFQALGMKPNFMIGKTFSSLAPPSLSKHFQDLIAQCCNPDKEMSSLHKMSHLFISHASGSIIPVNCQISLYPFLERGVSLHVIIRPLVDSKEYIIVTRDGYIESYTQGLAKELKLSISKSEKIHIGRLNKQLMGASLAMNTMINANLEAKEQVTSPAKLNTLDSFQEKLKFDTRSEVDASTTMIYGKRRTQRTLTVQKSQQIYNKFSKEGGERLVLVPLSKNDKLTSPLLFSDLIDQGRGVKYNCIIENRYYDENVVKLFIFEKAQLKNSDIGEVSPPVQTKRNKNYTLKTDFTIMENEQNGPVISARVTSKMEGEDENSCSSGNFDTENEKHEDEYKSENKYDFNTLRLELPNRTTLYDTLASPKLPLMLSTSPREGDSGVFMNSGREIKLLPQDLIGETDGNMIPFRRRSRVLSTFNFEDAKKKENYAIEDAQQSTGSVNTRLDEKKIYATLRESLDVKHCSMMIKIFLWICYGLIILFIASQIATSFDAKNHFQNLKWKKDVLVNAEVRIDLITKIQRRFRILGLIPEGFFTEAQINQQVPNARAVFLGLATGEVNQLAEANDNLILDSSSLEEQERQTLFENNVRVFSSGGPVYQSTDVYDVVTTFQAANTLIGLSTKAIMVSKVNLTAALPIYYLVSRNSLDDMLVESRRNTDAVSTLLDTSHASMLTKTRAILGVVVASFGLLLIGAVFVLYRLYKQEVEFLSDLSKMDSSLVQKLGKEVMRFQANINEDTYYEEANIESMSGYCQHLLHLEKPNQNKRKQAKTIKNTKVRVKYGKYLFRVVLFFVYLAIFVTIDRVIILKSTSKLYAHVKKIRFMKQLQEEGSLLSIALIEVVASNATTTIMNQNSEEFYNDQILQFRDFRLEVPTVLRNDDNTPDTFLDDVLNGNGCQYLTGILQLQCNMASKGSQVNGLLSFMTSIESITSTVVATFMKSPRTMQAAVAITFTSIGVMLPMTDILTGLNGVIHDYLTEKFDDEIHVFLNVNTLVNALGISLLVIFSGMLWIFALKQIRECDNDLKKVLKNFPMNFAINIPKLRMFVFQTSNNTLRSLKDKI